MTDDRKPSAGYGPAPIDHIMLALIREAVTNLRKRYGTT